MNNDAPAGDERYVNASQRVLIAVVEALGDRMLDPQRLKELADSLSPEFSRDQVFRALRTLQSAGWAETVADGWILSPTLTRLSDRLRMALSSLSRRYLEGGS